MLPWVFLTPAGPWAHPELLLVLHSSTGCSVERCDSWLALTLFCCYYPHFLKLECALVRVGLPCSACVPMRVLCALHCRAQPSSELSQLLPAAGLCLLGAGRGV